MRNIRLLVSFLAATLWVHQDLIDWRISGVRVKLYPNDEPKSEQVYNNYRVCTADRSYWYLKSANLLDETKLSRHLVEDKLNQDGRWARANFSFNSGEYIRKILEIKYFIPYDERSALQVFDDPRDRELAAGPHVNQELCGLQLDYMYHLTQTHRINIVNSTEFSIFKLMDTFDWPKFGLMQLKNYHLGDYRTCVEFKLNVMKNELIKVNRSAAEWYFSSNLNKPEERGSIIDWIIDNLGPFVGLPKISRTAVKSMLKHEDKLRAVPMRYCLASIRWPAWSNSSHNRRNIALRTAACIPETCDSNSLEVHGEKLKRLLDLQSNDFHSGYYINDLYCLPDEQSKLRDPFYSTGTILFIAFNIIWLSITLVAVMVDLSGGEPGKYLACWSLKKNWTDFCGVKKGQSESLPSSSSSKIDLEPLEGMKILASLLVIGAHTISISLGLGWNSETGHYLMSEAFTASLFTIYPTSVDIFFVLTGVLTMILLMAKQRKLLLRPAFWIGYIIYRYIRIVPLYALFHWFLQSSFRFIGSGPLWDYGTSHSAWSSICQNESWLDILWPQANTKSPNNTCNAVGWYLANDIQFTLITPFIVVLYVLKPRLARWVVGSSIVALVANHIRYYQPFKSSAPNVFQWDLMTFTGVFHETTDGYVRPQYRVVSYLIGLMSGHLLHEYGKRVPSAWSRPFIVFGKVWLYFSIYFLSFTPFISSLLPLDNEHLLTTLAPLMLGTTHFIASISAAVFILLLCTGHLPNIATIYRWSGFRLLAKASLPTLLVQVPLAHYHSQTIRALPELSRYYLMSNYIMWTLESFLIGVLVHLLYEIPIRRFLNKFLIGMLVKEDEKVWDLKSAKEVTQVQPSGDDKKLQ